ncbi:amidohydrolase family protein [Hirschia litorea]|uniref:Amidohydrolase family protein n=1 Tax=Hirschia litorea TaxID=1199156 RepID=A0ABW2IJK5_9PROT
MKIHQLLTHGFTLVAAVFMLSACGGQKRPDVIYLGGTIYTGNPEAPIAEAVATIGMRITYVGDANSVLADTHPKTRLVDLKGGAMYPGFIDTHTGALANGVDDALGTQIQASVQAYAKQGWTTIHAYNVLPENVRIMEDLAMARKLPVRVYNVLNQAGFESLATYGPGVSPGGLVETRAIVLDVEKPLPPLGESGDIPTLPQLLKLALKQHVQIMFKIPSTGFGALLDEVELALDDSLPDADPRWGLLYDPQVDPEELLRAMEMLEPSVLNTFKGEAQLQAEPVYQAFVGKAPEKRQNILEYMTLKAAKAGFRDDMIGSIEVGKLADFSIMSGDLLTLSDEELEGVTPVMTVIGGAQAWPPVEQKLPVFGE